MPFNNLQHISKKNIVLAVIMVLLVLGNIFFATEYFLQMQQIHVLQTQVAQHQTNARVVAFLNLFIQKVLKSNTEVSFDDRLQLENAVRAINDPNILAQWEEFTNGTTQDQIQQGVKDLLQALVQKISY